LSKKREEYVRSENRKVLKNLRKGSWGKRFLLKEEGGLGGKKKKRRIRKRKSWGGGKMSKNSLWKEVGGSGTLYREGFGTEEHQSNWVYQEEVKT